MMGNKVSVSTSTPETTSSTPGPKKKPEDTLPLLTPWEFEQYNQLAVKMDYYHNMFRDAWRTMSTACQKRALPSRTSLSSFLDTALHFCNHLKGHHDLEETYYFPILARKMPCFAKEMEMPSQHQQIHGGLLELKEFLEEKKAELERGEADKKGKGFEWDRMEGIMGKFGAVLWQHLNEEVEALGAEHMRKYWTLQEMRYMPF